MDTATNNERYNGSDSTDTMPLKELLGTKLVSCKGDEICTATLAAKKQIILYFSVHWCPPCRGFTPRLSKAYEDYVKSIENESEIELIFVSSDFNENAFTEYHAEMTLPATLFDPDSSAKLGEKFGVCGIPSMVTINAGGEHIENDVSVDMCSLIDEHGVAAFPLTQSRILEQQV